MKKRCTNSKCRKLFSVKASNGHCPYCGRHYSGVSIPRVRTISSCVSTDMLTDSATFLSCDIVDSNVVEDNFFSVTTPIDVTASFDVTAPFDVTTPIDDLDLSIRSFNCLKRAGINTVEDLIGKTESQIAAVRNFSRKCVIEVEDKLQSLNLSLLPET